MSKNAFRILLTSTSRDGASNINHLFRNAGQAVQTHRITSFEDLGECLNESHWDLALCDANHDELDADTILDTLNKARCDTPVIVLVNDYDSSQIVKGLSNGAQDVIQHSNKEHLLYAANREVKHLRVRREFQELERSLDEANGRFDTLMAQADDAIAYILDGMHVDVNDAYAQLLGYEDKDDFLAIPVIDLVAGDDQEKFKIFLKHYHGEGEQEIALQCVQADDKEFAVRMKFAPAVFDEEKCTQVIVRRMESDSGTSGSEALNEMHSRFDMVDQIDEFLSSEEENNGCLLYLSINDFSQLKTRLGLSGSRHLRENVAEILQDAFSDFDDALTSQYGEESFTILLPGQSQSETHAMAESICQTVAEQMFEIDQQTAQCSCSVGLVDFSKCNFSSSNAAMDRAFLALEQARQKFSDGESGSACIVAYDPNKDDGVEVNFNIESLAKEERLRLQFQPVVSLLGEAMECYETSVLLLDAENERLAVDPLFQSINQRPGDTALDKWMVLEATRQLKAQGADERGTALFVRLTQNALIDEEFPAWFATALKASEIDPSQLVLQFEQQTLSHYLKQAMRAQSDFFKLKMRFAISEFVHTPDSMKLLDHFCVNYVIAAGSYTLDLQENPANSSVLASLLSELAEHNVSSIVPLVENAATMATLWQMNTQYIKGHYFQKPSERMDYQFAEE